MYARGANGVPKDAAEGVKWLRRSAEQGYAVAQYYLGVAYLEGTGVEPDQQRAVAWISEAARQGYKGAEELLQRAQAGQTKP
jgi:TPR repeat protein